MKTLDFTELILKSGSWFIIGVLVYYVLTFMKVHLIWKIQERVGKPEFEKTIFVGVRMSFFVSFFSNLKIHQGTFEFLFNYKEDNFKIRNHWFNGRLNKRVILLEAFTFFLKPFIICGFLFAVLELWIDSEIMYDKLKVLIKELDKIIEHLNTISFVKVFKEFKMAIFLFFGIALIFVPRVIMKKRAKGAVKKKILLNLNIFLIILNVSFFSSETGHYHERIFDEVIDYKNYVLDINYNVINNLSAEIAANEFVSELERENLIYQDGLNDFREKTAERNFEHLDEEVRSELYDQFESRKEEISEMIIKLKEFYFNPKRTLKKTYSSKGSKPHFYESYTNQKQGSPKNEKYRDYFSDSKEWNYKMGKEAENFVDEITKSSPKNEYYTTFKEVYIELIKYGFATLLNTEYFGNESIKTVKKVASLVLENGFPKFSKSKFFKVFRFFSNPEKASEELYEKGMNYTVDQEVQKFRETNDRFYSKAISDAKKMAFNLKIERANAIIALEKKARKMLEYEILKINKEIRARNEKRKEGGIDEPLLPEFNNARINEILEKFKNNELSNMKTYEIKEISASLNFKNNFLSKVGTSVSLHPFPKNACPICVFQLFKNLY